MPNTYLPIDPQRLIGFAPDVDQSTPGAFQDCNNVIPTLIGFKSAASPINAGLPALPSKAMGGALILNLDGTARMLVGTDTHLYEGTNGEWVDQSATSGYSIGTDAKWRFASMGNVSLAVNGSSPLQVSVGTTFSPVPSSPVGSIVFMANGQLFICNCSSPATVSTGDSWYCSGLDDYTQWDTTNMQTLSAYGRLLDTPGPIIGGAALGPNAILFKKKSMFIGTQMGAPIGWGFQKISNEVGTLCNESIVATNNALYFIGPDDFYMYQGSGDPQKIGMNVRKWFFANLNPSYQQNICSYHDQSNKVIYWAFPSNSSLDGTVDLCLTFNYETGCWGMMNAPMQGFITILNGQITYDGVGVKWEKFSDLPNVSFNSGFWINFTTTPGYFDNTNTLQYLAGTSTGATIATNAFGDDMFWSRMTQMRIRFKQAPASGTCVWQGRAGLGNDDPQGITNTQVGDLVLPDSRIDIDKSGKWHQLILTFKGDFEAIQWTPICIKQGRN